jgi:hypothetical protein
LLASANDALLYKTAGEGAMAGGYTHLTLVRSAISDLFGDKQLDRVFGPFGHFAYLGAVSPDYPYLTNLKSDIEWADRMHKGGTDAMIKAAMPRLFKELRRDENGTWRSKFAWLLGFVSHVVADVTIHPVVNLMVGKYEDHKTEHRFCEMNEDVWIYDQQVGLDLHASNEMKSHLRRCGTKFDLNDVVEELWRTCFLEAYGVQPGDMTIDKWNFAFIEAMDIAEARNRIPFFGRKLVGDAYLYPRLTEVNNDFIKGLKVPDNKDIDSEIDQQPVGDIKLLDFDKIFEKALNHIKEAWGVLRDDLFTESDAVGTKHAEVFGNWSLDTGIDHKDMKLRLWPEKEKLVRT